MTSELVSVADALEEFAMIDEAEGGNPQVIATERRAAELLREADQSLRSAREAEPVASGDQMERLLHLLVAALDGHSIDMVPMDKTDPDYGKRLPGFSVGRNRSVRLQDIAAIFHPSPSTEGMGVRADVGALLDEFASDVESLAMLEHMAGSAPSSEQIAQAKDDIADTRRRILSALSTSAEQVEITDAARNKIINRCSHDLENIINGHDPEIHSLNNRVWDRLDQMATELEHHVLTAALSPSPKKDG